LSLIGSLGNRFFLEEVMMLKIFLVEDEFVVREGIKKNIDWKGHGYDFCGEASDGELAYPMIQKLKPDIVITDIKMPFMDGLELSKLIKKEFPWIEIVILSGYAEFDYAKEAISLGVAHYLTKPISGDALIEQIDSLAAKIEESKRQKELQDKYLRDMEENAHEEQKKLFQYLVSGSKSVTELLDMADGMGMDISAIWYNILLIKVTSKNHAPSEYSGSVVDIYNKLLEGMDTDHEVVFDRGTEGTAVIYKADSLEELKKIQSESIERITSLSSIHESIRYFGGIGTPVNRLRELGTAFEAASRAFAHRYFVDDNRIMEAGDNIARIDTGNEKFNISNVDPNKVDRARVNEFLKQGELSELNYFLDEFYQGMDENALQSTIFRQYILMDIYFAAVAFLDAMELDRNQIEPVNVAAPELQDINGAKNYIKNTLTKTIELRDASASKKYNNVVDNVISYIDEHYADDELSLNFLASYVNFSPNHLSMMFSQETGVSFIKYLTDYRMNKAKELLRCTNKRSVDISTMVGYKDPHYFSYCFKKYQGMTPTQYRRGKGVVVDESDSYEGE